MSDLDIIELGAQAMSFPSARGRKAKPLMLAAKRSLTPADAERLLDPDTVLGSETPPLARIRETHHSLARLIAQGLKDVEVSEITGYSPSRISVLKKDPAFQELLVFYSETVKEKFIDVHERLARLGTSFVDELQERLEATPETFTVGQLMQGAEFALDRSVAPPKSAQGMQGKNGQGNGQSVPAIQITFVSPQKADALPTVVRVDHDEDRAVLELEAEEM